MTSRGRGRNQVANMITSTFKRVRSGTPARSDMLSSLHLGSHLFSSSFFPLRVFDVRRPNSYCQPDVGYFLEDMFLCKEEVVPIYYANHTTKTTWKNQGREIYLKGNETKNLIWIMYGNAGTKIQGRYCCTS